MKEVIVKQVRITAELDKVITDESVYSLSEELFQLFETNKSKDLFISSDDEKFLKKNGELVRITQLIEDLSYFVRREKMSFSKEDKKLNSREITFMKVASENAENISGLSKEVINEIHQGRAEGKDTLEIVRGIASRDFQRLVLRRKLAELAESPSELPKEDVDKMKKQKKLGMTTDEITAHFVKRKLKEAGFDEPD
mgnify:CR=1 FL=1